jgi:hypothetical protein
MVLRRVANFRDADPAQVSWFDPFPWCNCVFCPPLQFSVSLSRTNVAALNGGLGGTETQTDVLVPSSASLSRSSRLGLDLGVLEDVRLLLVSTLRLDGKLGRHFCDCRWSMVAKVVRWPSWWLT